MASLKLLFQHYESLLNKRSRKKYIFKKWVLCCFQLVKIWFSSLRVSLRIFFGTEKLITLFTTVSLAYKKLVFFFKILERAPTWVVPGLFYFPPSVSAVNISIISILLLLGLEVNVRFSMWRVGSFACALARQKTQIFSENGDLFRFFFALRDL